jgi:hypothetical protein
MQAVSAAFTTAAAASAKKVSFGCLIAWNLTPNASFQFFTINQSKIGGADIIKGAGGAITFFDKYQYTDESPRLIDAQIDRKLPQKPYGVIMATAQVTLDNTSKRYTPNYDGTIGAFILPNRPIKLSVAMAGESVQQFVGFTDRPISGILDRKTTIQAYDALSYLVNKKSSLQSFVNQTADYIITQLLIEQGFSSTQYNIEPSLQNKISYYNPAGQQTMEMLKELVEAEMGLMFVDENGIIQFWNKQHLNNNATSRWALNYSNLTDLKWDNTPIINSVLIRAKPYKVMAKNLLWTNGQPITLAPNSATDVFADFKDDVGSFAAVSLDTPLPIASATTSEYTANYNADGSGGDASAGVSLTSSYLFGARYRMTFTNTTNQNIYLTKVELYGTPAKAQLIDDQTYDDTTSQTAYGINPNNNGAPLEIDNNVIQDSSTAAALAYLMVKLYGQPLFRLICPTFAAPHLQLGDAVSVTIADTAQTKLCFIVGISTKFSRGNITQQFDVEERTVYSYFTINVSKIGGSDFLSP